MKQSHVGLFTSTHQIGCLMLKSWVGVKPCCGELELSYLYRGGGLSSWSSSFGAFKRLWGEAMAGTIVVDVEDAEGLG